MTFSLWRAAACFLHSQYS